MATIGKLLVSLGLEGKGYQKGLAAAAKSAQAMARSVEKNLGGLSKTVDVAAGGVGGKLAAALGPTLGRAAAMGAAAVTGVIAVIGALVAVAAVAVAGLAALAAILGGVAAGAFALAKAAAPIDGIRRAFEGLTSTIEGGSARMLAALQAASAGMVSNAELMRSFNLAAQLVGVQFAEQLPDALQYLTKVSMATGESMDYLLNSLVRGVGRLQPLILDNLGVSIQLSDAYEQWATATNRTVASMTKAEQQAAVMAFTMEKLRANTAALPEVFGSAGQVFAAFRTDLQNIKDQVGMDLLPIWVKLLSIFRQFLPLLGVLGSAFAGAFSGIVRAGIAFVKSFGRALGIDFDRIAGKAETWGANIVVMLARGMAKAIATVLIVLNRLGQAIASWLAPGSPPRILPHIVEWGTETANLWLSGFTAANVGILRSLSGMVEQYLRSAPGAGGAGLAQTILDARRAIEQALAGGANVLSTLPANVQAWASALLSASAAAEAVTAAQEALNEVTRQYDEQLRPISDRLKGIQRERDAFVRQQRRAYLQSVLADPAADADARRFAALELEELALMEQEQAIEDARDTAVDAAQDRLDAAQAEQAQAEERLRLEEQLLQQQLETNRLLQEMVGDVNAAAGATGGLAGAAGGLAGALDGVMDSLEGLGEGSLLSGVAAQVEAAFKPVEKAAHDLGATWGGVWNSMLKTFNDWRAEFDVGAAFLQDVLGMNLPEVLSKLRDKWGKEIWPGMVSDLDIYLKKQILPWLETHTPQIVKDLWETWSKYFTLMGDKLGTFYTDTFHPKMVDIREWLETHGPAALAAFHTAWLVNFGLISANLLTFYEETFLPKLTSIKEWLEEKMPAALGAFGGAVTTLKDGVLLAFKTMLEQLLSAASSLWTFLTTHTFRLNVDFPDLPDWAWPTSSPMPIHQALYDFARFLDRESFRPDMAFPDVATPAGVLGAGLRGVDPAAAGDMRPVQVTVGPVSIHNGMDLAHFELRVEQAVMRAWRRR